MFTPQTFYLPITIAQGLVSIENYKLFKGYLTDLVADAILNLARKKKRCLCACLSISAERD